jgi:uncharacterized membrane protein YdbT with pleckstrin-like domain
MADHTGTNTGTVSKFHPLAYLKAIASGIATAIFVLIGYVQGEETLHDVTTNEWLYVLLAVFLSFGITYYIPNKQVISSR